MQLAQDCLNAHRIDPRNFCTNIMRSLREGRSPHTPVVVLMGSRGGEGKSFLLAPLKSVYGTDSVQLAPQAGSFPLLGLEKKKVALLDEWMFDTTVVPLATQLLWLEGKPFPIARPQNKDYTGHLMYQGTAPLFITCKESDLGPILARANMARAQGWSSMDTMLARRLCVYPFWVRLPVRPGEYVPECAFCFAKMLLQHTS